MHTACSRSRRRQGANDVQFSIETYVGRGNDAINLTEHWRSDEAHFGLHVGAPHSFNILDARNPQARQRRLSTSPAQFEDNQETPL